ncbi:MAG: glycine--tRNA ligase subunit beta [Thermoanaerobaculia bacterium]
MSHSYVFEIVLEEIPAWMIPARLDAIRKGLEGILSDFGGSEAAPVAMRVGATSRRIWFTLADLPGRQEDRSEEIKGPSAKAAFDSEGKPTRAVEGFLRKNDAKIEQLATRDDYVWLNRTVEGKRIEDVLAAGVPRLIESLHWPKSMRWGTGEHSYIRPVHSVVSAFDGEPLPLTIFGTASGITSVGHRILAPGAIEIRTAAEYEPRLEKASVVADAGKRVQILRDAARRLAAEVGGEPAEDEQIWDQWKFLTEYPGLVRAEFDPAFHSIPFEVLVTVMRVHQKQLPIWKGGELTSSYLAVMDQESDVDGNVAGGNAFVTNARFADARFFHETDRRHPLEERLPELSRLQFQEKLGSYRDKTDRIVRIASAIARELNLGDAAAIEEAARLAKADLVTEMVKEFTELQGKIGGIYAREEGKSDLVWMAVYDHYLPVSVEDEMPRTVTGAVVSLADKLDTLSGFFRIGLRPSGSKDPFALRRAAQGIVQILLNRKPWSVEMPVETLVSIGLEAHGATSGSETLAAELREFLADRVRTLLEHPRYGAWAYDEIAATMESGWGNSLPDLLDRLAAVRAARSSPQFLSILDSAKRIRNIAGEEASTVVNASLLGHPAEKRLYELSGAVIEQIDELVAGRRYSDALDSFAAMAPELETFFNDVLVMVDDQAVRTNRVALLNRVGSAARRIADVTKIVVARRDYNSR